MTAGSRLDFWLVMGLVCLSGNQAFTAAGRTEPMLALAAVGLAALLLHRRQSLLTRRLHVVVLVFSAIFLLQTAYFHFFPAKTIAGFMVRIFVGCAVVRLVRDFPLTYVRVMAWTAIISLFFYIPEQLGYLAGVDVKLFFAPIERLVAVPVDYNILIYNFDIPQEIHRNSAFFWEPGAFAGYLLLALMFLGLRKDALAPPVYRRFFWLLTAALLTTFSTLGYLLLPIALLLHLSAFAGRAPGPLRVAYRLALLPLLAILLYQGWQLDFVQQKVAHQFTQAAQRSDNWQQNRFGTMLYDWQYIQRKPLVGWGLHERTRLALHHGQEMTGLGNGLSGALVRFGTIGFGLWLFATALALKRQASGRIWPAAAATATVVLLLNGETFLNFPLYWGLMFLAPPTSDLGTEEGDSVGKEGRLCLKPA